MLPGVTVEASSPALIEKVRSAVTDGSGQYRIVSLEHERYKKLIIEVADPAGTAKRLNAASRPAGS